MFLNSIDNAVMTLYKSILNSDQTDLMFVLAFSRVARFHDQLQHRDAYQGCRRPCSQVSSPTRAIASKMRPRITMRRSVRRSESSIIFANQWEQSMMAHRWPYTPRRSNAIRRSLPKSVGPTAGQSVDNHLFYTSLHNYKRVCPSVRPSVGKQ